MAQTGTSDDDTQFDELARYLAVAFIAYYLDTSLQTAEKRYQIVKEALSQKEQVGQIARRHQVSEGLIYRGRDKFFEGAKRLWRLMGAM